MTLTTSTTVRRCHRQHRQPAPEQTMTCFTLDRGAPADRWILSTGPDRREFPGAYSRPGTELTQTRRSWSTTNREGAAAACRARTCRRDGSLSMLSGPAKRDAGAGDLRPLSDCGDPGLRCIAGHLPCERIRAPLAGPASACFVSSNSALGRPTPPTRHDDQDCSAVRLRGPPLVTAALSGARLEGEA